MAKFRKKPVVIEAVQWEGRWPDSPPDWLAEAGRQGKAYSDQRSEDERDPPFAIFIETLEGTHRGDPGDWIIRGVKGELYPCKPDIFAATYDPVESER